MYRGFPPTFCSTGRKEISHSMTCHNVILFLDSVLINTYSMKQTDLYYFETIKMTSPAYPNFVWRIQAAGEYSLWTVTRLMTSFLWFQNSIDQAVSLNKSFIIYRTTVKSYFRMSQLCKRSQTESACVATSTCMKVTT